MVCDLRRFPQLVGSISLRHLTEVILHKHDCNFLKWIQYRLINVHKENPHTDYTCRAVWRTKADYVALLSDGEMA